MVTLYLTCATLTDTGVPMVGTLAAGDPLCQNSGECDAQTERGGGVCPETHRYGLACQPPNAFDPLNEEDDVGCASPAGESVRQCIGYCLVANRGAVAVRQRQPADNHGVADTVEHLPPVQRVPVASEWPRTTLRYCHQRVMQQVAPDIRRT